MRKWQPYILQRWFYCTAGTRSRTFGENSDRRNASAFAWAAYNRITLLPRRAAHRVRKARVCCRRSRPGLIALHCCWSRAASRGSRKGRISGGSFAEMITAVTHPHQHGGKDKEAPIFCPCIKLTVALLPLLWMSMNQSLVIFFAQNANWKRSAAYAFKTRLKLNWL